MLNKLRKPTKLGKENGFCYTQYNRHFYLGVVYPGDWFIITNREEIDRIELIDRSVKTEPKEPYSMTALCRRFHRKGGHKEAIYEYLIHEGYLIDSNHATEKGLEKGIVQTPKQLRYSNQAVDWLISMKETINQTYIHNHIDIEYVDPHLESIDYPKMCLPKDFCILDVEATGLGDQSEVFELAILDSKGKGLYNEVFLPICDFDGPALGVSKVSKWMLKGAKCFKNEWPTIKSLLNGKMIIGHNLSYDVRMIKSTLVNHYEGKILVDEEVDPLFVDAVDSIKLVKNFYESESYSLEVLYPQLCENEKQSHRAAGDCLMTLKVLRAIEQGEYQRIGNRYPYLFSEEKREQLLAKETKEEKPKKKKSNHDSYGD